MSSESPQPAVKTAAIATRYGVTQRTAQRWLKRWGAEVVAADELLAKELLGDTKTPSSVRRVAASILADLALDAGAVAVADVSADPEKAAGNLRGVLNGLQKHLDWADRQLRVAQSIHNQADVLTYSRLYRELNSAVVANRLAQAKLGIDTGELIPRAEFARLAYALASRAALGIQRLRDKVAPSLVHRDSAEEVAERLEPTLIADLFVAPMARAANLAAGVGLPAWVVDEITRAVADHVATGAQVLTAARTQDLT